MDLERLWITNMSFLVGLARKIGRLSPNEGAPFDFGYSSM